MKAAGPHLSTAALLFLFSGIELTFAQTNRATSDGRGGRFAKEFLSDQIVSKYQNGLDFVRLEQRLREVDKEYVDKIEAVEKALFKTRKQKTEEIIRLGEEQRAQPGSQDFPNRSGSAQWWGGVFPTPRFNAIWEKYFRKPFDISEFLIKIDNSTVTTQFVRGCKISFNLGSVDVEGSESSLLATRRKVEILLGLEIANDFVKYQISQFPKDVTWVGFLSSIRARSVYAPDLGITFSLKTDFPGRPEDEYIGDLLFPGSKSNQEIAQILESLRKLCG